MPQSPFAHRDSDLLLPKLIRSATLAATPRYPGNVGSVGLCRAEALAAQQAIKAVLNKLHQTLERPAWRGISARYGRLGRNLLGGADCFAQSRRDPRAKGGRPPLRRYSSAAGPCSL